MPETSVHLLDAVKQLGAREWTTLRLEKVIRPLDIGTKDYEFGTEQPVRFDIEVLLLGSAKPRQDTIEEVLDYEYLYRAIDSALEVRHSLQETIASNILDTVMDPEPVVAGVVCMTKLSPPGFDGRFGCTLVRIKPGLSE